MNLVVTTYCQVIQNIFIFEALAPGSYLFILFVVYRERHSQSCHETTVTSSFLIEHEKSLVVSLTQVVRISSLMDAPFKHSAGYLSAL